MEEKEKKFVWRLRDVDFYRVAEAESWLSDMSEKGLHLKSAGSFFCSFEKSTSKKIRYRLEPRGKSDPSEEYVEACQEMGWELVDCWKGTFLIWQCEQREVPEFHTDPFAESYAFKRLSRTMMWNSIISVIGVILVVLLVARKYFTAPVTQLVSDHELFSMILFLSFIWSDIEVIKQWISISRLTKKLRSGEDIHEEVKVTHKLNWLPDAVYLVSAIVMIVIPFYGIAQSRTGPADRFDLKVPRLCEIENGVAIKEGLIIDGIDYGNFVSTSWAWLAPEQLELHEQGYVDEEVWEEWHQAGREDEEIPITYKAKYYRLRFEFLAEPLTDEIAANLSEELSITFEQVDNNRNIRYGRKENLQHLIVQHENEVVHLRYMGPKDLKNCLPIITEKLTQNI